MRALAVACAVLTAHVGAARGFSLPTFSVSLEKPLGIMLEERGDGGGGAVVVDLATGGNAEASGAVLEGDVLVRVGDREVADASFDDIMGAFEAADGAVDLQFARPAGTVVVRFPTGRAVAARSGDRLRAVAEEARHAATYNCGDGGCGSCEHAYRGGDGAPRFVRLCVARVPKGFPELRLLDADDAT